MKNTPLAVQIWLVITAVTVLIFSLLSLLIPPSLESFFSREIYRTIETEQNKAFGQAGNSPDRFGTSIEQDQELQDTRSVRTILLHPDGHVMPARTSVPAQALERFRSDSKGQNEALSRYSLTLGEHKLLYLIRKVQARGQTMYLISYMWDTYHTGLVNNLLVQLLRLMGVTILISLLPSVLLARYLSKPLVRLEGSVKKIAERELQEPVEIGRRDEIGRLAESIDKMRLQLRQQEEYQQSMLQHVSHELKTPVMVIRSYTQSIQDGIYPKGNLEGSLQVIESEAERLEKRVLDLLYLTKLDYMAIQKPTRQPFRLDLAAESVVERLRWKRPELHWSLSLEEAILEGDPEQWNVALENLFDNQIRHAQTRIEVSLRSEKDREGIAQAVLAISNDGPHVEPRLLELLFQPFEKGHGGRFGLGLTIVKRVTDLHGASITVDNETNGVRFTLVIPTRLP